MHGYFASVGFSFCALLFLILTMIMYLSKEKYKNTENTIFIVLLILTFLLIFLEFIYCYNLSNIDVSDPKKIPLLTKALCRSYLIGIIIWMGIFIYYVVVQMTRIYTEPEIKRKKRTLYLRILGAIVLVVIGITFIFPIKYYDYSNRVYSFGGIPTTIAYIMAVFLMIAVIYGLVFNNKVVSSSQKLPLYFAIIFTIGVSLLQFVIPETDYNTQNFQFTIMLIALFFTLENQDNKLLIEREKSKEEAEKMNQEQTEFLTSMSHEIRTPMSAIMGYSESLLREKNLTQEIVKRDTKYIHIAAVLLLDLINNILDLSRMDSEKETVVEQEYDLKALLLEIDQSMKNKLENKNVKFEINVDENLPCKYLSDGPKISKSILNILSYVTSKASDGKIILSLNQHKLESGEFAILFLITAETTDAEDNFETYISDFNNINENKVNNITLGLIVAKKYIEMLEGTASVNKIDSFINYKIVLGQQISNPNKVGNIFEEIEMLENLQIDLTGKKILVVDDNKVNIKLISRLLEEFKAEIDSATSGLECIDKAQVVNYDLIFLDHMMPGLDGVQTLEKLKDIIQNLPPCIALTANSYSGAREKYKEDGFYDYLAKPFNYNDLKKLLYNIFIKNREEK